MDAHTSWAIDRPITSPFAVPKGFLGRLAGRLMLLINKPDAFLAVRLR